MFDSFRQWFWNEPFWLGGNRTWEQLESAGYRRYNDIYYSIYTALAWLAIRFVLERYVFVALARWLGISDKPNPKPQPNLVLELNYNQLNGKIPQKMITGLAKQADLTERKVERWLRIRAQQDRPTLVAKFSESVCKLSIYGFLFVFGLAAMWDKPCLWDSEHCIRGYPEHYVSNGIWWLYNMEIGLYLSLLVSQFFDVKRKDFFEMFIHHVVTLALLTQSWAININLIGSLTMVIHDVVDIFLELSKCLIYLKKNYQSQIVFHLFAALWVITRLGIFPYRIIYYTLYVSLSILPDMPGYWFLNTFFLMLLTLHSIWTYFIFRMAFNKWKNGTLKDSRSDDDDDDH